MDEKLPDQFCIVTARLVQDWPKWKTVFEAVIYTRKVDIWESEDKELEGCSSFEEACMRMSLELLDVPILQSPMEGWVPSICGENDVRNLMKLVEKHEKKEK